MEPIKKDKNKGQKDVGPLITLTKVPYANYCCECGHRFIPQKPIGYSESE